MAELKRGAGALVVGVGADGLAFVAEATAGVGVGVGALGVGAVPEPAGVAGALPVALLAALLVALLALASSGLMEGGLGDAERGWWPADVQPANAVGTTRHSAAASAIPQRGRCTGPA